MRRTLFLLAASAALVLPAAAHAKCYGVPDPLAPIYSAGHVCGTIYKLKANGWEHGSPTYVKYCPKGSKIGCTSVQTTTQYDAYGTAFQNFTFPYFRQGASGYQDFDIYLWSVSSTDYWGSSTVVHGTERLGPFGVDGISYAVAPRPLPPTPVYPVGTTVPSSYTVRWKSGLDADRTRYPTTYQVWFKYWPFGGTEPANWSLSATGLPCHANGSGPDGNNECSTYVAGPQPAGNWKWYVVADANMSSVIYYPGVTAVFSTTSSSVSFVQP